MQTEECSNCGNIVQVIEGQCVRCNICGAKTCG